MSAHDTAEAVEAMATWNAREAATLRAHHVDMGSMPELAEMHENTAAMLRRLHARAVDAERDEAYKSGFCDGYEDGEKAALATARADALREAAEAIRVKIAAQSEETERWRQARNLTAANVAAARAKTLKTALSAILALIEKGDQ